MSACVHTFCMDGWIGGWVVGGWVIDIHTYLFGLRARVAEPVVGRPDALGVARLAGGGGGEGLVFPVFLAPLYFLVAALAEALRR